MQSLVHFNRLYCRCAELTAQRGYTHFGLQFYGECWSGPNAAARFGMQGKSERCIGVDYNHCVDSAETECIGKDHTNYIYQLVKENSKWGFTYFVSNWLHDVVSLYK